MAKLTLNEHYRRKLYESRSEVKNQSDKSARAEIISKVIHRAKSRMRKDIEEWKRARREAEHIKLPRRNLLYTLYDDVVIDNHLYSMMTSRKHKTKGEKFAIHDKNSGEKDDDKTALLKRPWFYQLLDDALDALFYGHTLIEIKEFSEGEISNIEVVPRYHVVPEKGGVIKDLSNPEDMIPYRDPPYNKWVIEISAKPRFGLLFKAAPNMLIKKHVQQSWSEFAEIFGMPLRWATTETRNDKDRQQVINMMKAMGSAAYGVFPPGTEINFEEATGGNQTGGVYDNLVARINSEMSKLMFGQTMTADDGSSRSQAEVHENVAHDYVQADKQFISFLMNWQVLPILRMHGYPLTENDVFKWDDAEELSIKDQWAMYNQALTHYDIDPEQIEEKFGIKVLRRRGPSPTNDPTNHDPGKKKVDNAVLNLPKYKGKLCCSSPVILNQSEEEVRQINEKVINDVRGGEQDFSQQYMQWLAGSYVEALQSGWSLEGINYNAPDHFKRSMMELNLFRFSAAKSKAGIRQLNKVLQKSESLSDFRKKAGTVLEDYNQNWLRTEYNTARTSGANAANYNRHLRMKEEFPYWEYVTVGDNRVRESHRALHGKMFRADDPAFDRIYPPNGWNCRCDVVPRGDRQGRELSSEQEAIEALQTNGQFTKMRNYGFDINRGKLNKVFSANQLYLKEFDIDSLGRKAAGASSIRTILRKDLPSAGLEQRDEQFARAWFASKQGGFDLDDANKIRLPDHQGHPIMHLTRSTFMKKIRKGQTRTNLVNNIEEVLRSPDEVWFSRDNNPLLRYIKFYDGMPVNIIIQAKGGEWRITSWHDLDISSNKALRVIDENRRSGLLINK